MHREHFIKEDIAGMFLPPFFWTSCEWGDLNIIIHRWCLTVSSPVWSCLCSFTCLDAHLYRAPEGLNEGSSLSPTTSFPKPLFSLSLPFEPFFGNSTVEFFSSPLYGEFSQHRKAGLPWQQASSSGSRRFRKGIVAVGGRGWRVI